MGKRLTDLLHLGEYWLAVLTAPTRSLLHEGGLIISGRRAAAPTFQFLAKHGGTDKQVTMRWVSPPATSELAQLFGAWSLLSASKIANEQNAAEIAFAGARRFETELACGSVASSFAEFAESVRTEPNKEVVGMLIAEADWLPNEWLGFCIIRRTFGANMFLDFLSANPQAGAGSKIGLVGTGMLSIVSEVMTAIEAKQLHIEGTPHSRKFYAGVFSVGQANLFILSGRRVRFAFRNWKN